MSGYDDLRRIALSLPGTYEQDLFGSPSFRVAKKIFITCAPEKNRVTLKLDPDHQMMLFEVRPEAFSPACGAISFGPMSSSIRSTMQSWKRC